jgi:signal transduction histidine kinase
MTLNLRSFLCVPLIGLDQRRLGVIQLDCVHQGLMFRHDDLELLTAISLHVASVLENAALHEARPREERLRQELAAQRGRDMALTTTVHNLRQPLFTLRAALTRMKESVQRGPIEIAETQRAAEDATRYLKRCEDIVNNVLRFSKEREFEPETVDLRDVIDAVVRGFRECRASPTSTSSVCPRCCSRKERRGPQGTSMITTWLHNASRSLSSPCPKGSGWGFSNTSRTTIRGTHSVGREPTW